MISDQTANLSDAVRIVRLRLRGTSRDYLIEFTDDEDDLRGLSVIAGEISTGKTSVLEFIDYCLGASRHPRHPEVLAQVRSAQLEVRLSGEPYVIERAVGEPSQSANVYPGELADLTANVPERRVIRPPGDPSSLSSFLLSHCGLEGIELKEAPNKAESGTDPLSFRDLMWLCYLPNERLDNKNLLHEGNHMQSLKLRQVVDVVFDTYDDMAAQLGRQVTELETRVAKIRAEIGTLVAFLREQGMRSSVELEMKEADALEAARMAARDLAEVDSTIRASTSFAEGLRAVHAAAADAARRAASSLRERETLAARLTPLRAQYAEDLRKLTFLSETKRIFDPLGVTNCPACLSQLARPPVIAGGTCSLCRSPIGPGRDGQPGNEAFNVESEIRSTRARLRELTEYVEEVDRELPGLAARAKEASENEAEAARSLDLASGKSVAPFIAQRDVAQTRAQQATKDLDDARAGLRMQKGVEDRSQQLERLTVRLEQARRELADVRGGGKDRAAVIGAISQRFGSILRDFKYPKLTEPFIDINLVPHVRGARYSEASSGARTLISLAWALSIFEHAYEMRAHHPGFLMIDSPQKNLGSGNSDEDEFQDARIVAGFYDHVRRWLAGDGRGAQIVVVDNNPPVIADNHVVVRFTRDPARPPYGLIENEIG